MKRTSIFKLTVSAIFGIMGEVSHEHLGRVRHAEVYI